VTHDELMAGYYLAREAQDRQAEAATLQYQSELEDWYRVNPRLTFRKYLEGLRGR
jgi:hypothetical protein